MTRIICSSRGQAHDDLMNLFGDSYHQLRQEPYRFLFPIGLGHLVFGVMLWVQHHLNPMAPYPGLDHARFMIQGFLMCFSMGFLLTAIPRFTRTKLPTSAEAIVLLFLGIASGVHDFFTLVAFLFLAGFALKRRIYSKKINKPPFFIFVFAGFLFGLIGAATKFFSPYLFYSFGKVFLYDAMMLFWLVGIGSRILTLLLNRDSEPLTARQNQFLLWILGSSFLGQAVFSNWNRAFESIRALAVLLVSIRVWEIHRIPSRKNSLSLGIWIGILFMTLGLFLKPLFPNHGIHLQHLIYIGGYSLLALMVSVRVAVSHSGDSTTIQESRPRIWVGGALIGFAALTRYSAGLLSPDIYTSHLAYASITLLFGVFLIESLVLPRLFQGEIISSSKIPERLKT